MEKKGNNTVYEVHGLLFFTLEDMREHLQNGK